MGTGMTISERVRLDGAPAAWRTARLPPRPALIPEAQRLDMLLEHQEALAATLAAGSLAREELLAAYAAVLEWRCVFVADLAVDARWPDHAGLALARGYRSCWIEPVRACGEEPAVLLAGYGIGAAEPAGADERLIRLAVPFLASSLNAIQ